VSVKDIPIGRLRGPGAGGTFPVSPSSGDRFWHATRKIEYFFDGTRWLSTQLFSVVSDMTTSGVSADTAVEFPVPHLPLYDVLLVSWDTTIFRGAVGEWDIALYRKDAANIATIIDTQPGAADATTTNINRQRSLDVVLQAATTKLLRVLYDEISGTASIIAGFSVNYRLVG